MTKLTKINLHLIVLEKKQMQDRNIHHVTFINGCDFKLKANIIYIGLYKYWFINFNKTENIRICWFHLKYLFRIAFGRINLNNPSNHIKPGVNGKDWVLVKKTQNELQKNIEQHTS